MLMKVVKENDNIPQLDTPRDFLISKPLPQVIQTSYSVVLGKTKSSMVLFGQVFESDSQLMKHK